jgi:phosphoribosylformylglycinamidine synthase
VALAECCMMHDAPAGGGPAPWIGAAIRVPFPVRKDFVLFGEDASRIVVSLAPAMLPRLEVIAKARGAPLVLLGAVGGDQLEIQGALSVPVAELAHAWRDGIPSVLRRDVGHAAASGVTAG